MLKSSTALPLTVHKLMSGGDIQFYGSNARAILAAVVLLLHEEVKFVEAPEGCAILAMIMCKRLSQADVGKTTFVADRITHRKRQR